MVFWSPCPHQQQVGRRRLLQHHAGVRVQLLLEQGVRSRRRRSKRHLHASPGQTRGIPSTGQHIWRRASVRMSKAT